MGVLGEGRVRWAPAVLLGCVVLLVCAPRTLAAGGTGQIEGKVTQAVGGTAIDGIEVCAFLAGGGTEAPAGCATTDAGGEYAISELPSGEYDVEFAVPPGSQLDYIAQYYPDKSSFSEAQPVTVGAGVTSEIDAEMQEGGRIEGTVTDSQDAMPLQSIEVAAYKVGESKLSVGHAKTNASGEYTIVGLAQGSYKVEFSPTPESGLNFVTQYYDNKSSLATADEVKVTKGETKGEIDAKLRVGGEISGTVTDAWTHAPLSNIYVVALGPGEAFAGVANTNANGEYTIVGLAGGAYKIGFIGLAYIVQYYDSAQSPASADPVTAEQGGTTPGIDATLVRKEPVDTAAPVLAGTPAVGQTLTCSTGTWTGEPTPTYTYTWLRNGAAIPGASASSYGIQSADQGTGLACKVSATNKNGSASAVSDTLSVPVTPPPPAPTKPEVKLLSPRILVSGDSARVPISCAQATCTGTIELTERIAIRRRHRGRTRLRKETVVLGTGAYALSADRSATIFVHLTRAGRQRFAGARHHRLRATLQVSVRGGTTARGRVVLSEPAPRRRRR